MRFSHRYRGGIGRSPLKFDDELAIKAGNHTAIDPPGWIRKRVPLLKRQAGKPVPPVEIGQMRADDSPVTQGDLQPSGTTTSSPGESESPVCPVCGYDLRAITSDRCPECGLAIDRGVMSVSRIPWEHRRAIGRFNAFWRTVGLVLFAPGRFAEEVNRPVDHRSARRFQLVTVTLGWLAQSGWTIGPMLYDYLHLRGGWWFGYVIIGAICIAIWLYHWMASSVPSYWFQPKGLSVERQERAVALSYYASAPLAVLMLPAVMLLAWVVVEARYPNGIPSQMEMLMPLAAAILVALIFIYGYFLTVHLMRVMTQSDATRASAMAVLLPMHWLLCFLVAAVLPIWVYSLSLLIRGY